MKPRRFHSLWQANSLPPEALKLVEEAAASRARGDRVECGPHQVVHPSQVFECCVPNHAPVFHELLCVVVERMGRHLFRGGTGGGGGVK